MSSRVVQQTPPGNLSIGPSTGTMTFPGAITAGDALFVCLWATGSTGSGDILPPTDASLVNVYTLVQYVKNPFQHNSVWIFECESAVSAAAGMAVSITWTSSEFVSGVCVETLPVTGTVDTANAYQYGGTAINANCSIASAAAGNYVLAFASNGSGWPVPAGAGTIDGGTALFVSDDSPTGGDSFALYEGIAGATPSVIACGGSGTVADNWVCIAAAFSIAGGGGGSASLLTRPRRVDQGDSSDDGWASSDDGWAKRRVAFRAQAVAVRALSRRRVAEDVTADEYRRVRLARVPQAVQAWHVLAPQRRPNDEQQETVQRAPARLVAAAAMLPVLYLSRRGADELPAEDRHARLASVPASVAPWAPLAPIRRAQEDAQAAEVANARRFVGATAVTTQATAFPGQRRAIDDAADEAQCLARTAVFAPVTQAVSAVLAQPKRNAEAPEEERPQRKGFVGAAVAQALSTMLAQPKRNAEALDEERPQRKGFVSAAVAQAVSSILAQPRRIAETLEEERPQRKGFAVAQAPNVVLAQPKRNAEPIEEERPQRKGYVGAAVAQVVSAMLPQPKRNAEPIEEARTVRRTLWSFVTALLQSLGGTVRINEQAQSVSLSTEQVQQAAVIAQAQSVTIEGVESMYYVNTRTRMTFTFADFDGTPTDPTTVSLLIDGATVTPTRKAAGVWYYDYLPTTPGPKNYVITGTGAIAATRPGRIMVLAD